MDVDRLKEYILKNDKISDILEFLGCHHIRDKGEYFTAGNVDGDNTSAINVYKNDNITTVNHTRDILKGQKYSDIFSLVEFVKNCSFPEAIKYVCECVGIDYYHNFDDDLPESIKLTRLILQMQKGDTGTVEEKPLKPISEKILTYYKPYVNDMFYNDGIDYQTQLLFEVGYDEETNRITIPIRDEIGTLVGVKGRLFKDKLCEEDLKYIYIEPCARSQILYGLDKTYEFIRQSGLCYITEAEKGCQQLYSMGYKNSVATCGKKITTVQIQKLTRLCVDLIFLFDKDVSQDEIKEIADRFIDNVTIYAVIDKNGILDEKESPTDNKEKFEYLIKNNIYRIR